MEVFYQTLNQMLMMFGLIAVGFVLRRTKKVPESAGVTLAKLETYLFVPALSLYTQMTRCTVKTFSENADLILYGTVIITISIIVAYPLSRIFIKKKETSPEKEYRRSIYKYAMAFTNFGFMGNFMVLEIFGEEMFFKYSLFTFSLAILCNAWGLFILIPKDRNASIWQNLKKGLLTPPLIGIVLGILLGLMGLSDYVPDFVVRGIDTLGKCQGPVAMVLTGIVIGGYSIRKLVTNRKVYLASLFRLILIPSVIIAALKLMGADQEIIILALVAFATPLGLNTVIFPAAYGGETKTGASMAVVSHLISVATIPLMYLLFAVVL